MTDKAVAMGAYPMHNQDEYDLFLSQIKRHFNRMLKKYDNQLFTVSIHFDLFGLFLSQLPRDVRQHYTCNACRKFVNTFGGLVAITDKGETVPVMWPEKVPELYQNAVEAVRNKISNQKVTGVFYHADKDWGLPENEGKDRKWTHMSVDARKIAHKDRLRTAGQKSAEKREDYIMLHRAMREFPIEAVEQVVRITEADALYRTEKVAGVAAWFHEIHLNNLAGNIPNQRVRSNLTWKKVAMAPPGFCHIRNTMIGTLLEDIVSGLSFDVVSRRFSEKMQPDKYQQPQAAPKAGTIKRAEEIAETLGIGPSLERRFARFDEIHTFWKPKAVKPADVGNSGGGVFDHLTPKGKQEIKPMELPATTITWVKFLTTVLPNADHIEYYAPRRHVSYVAMTTAVNEDAPPILQWDTEEHRNPVSWYVYLNGSTPRAWNLTAADYCKVTGICLYPTMWHEQHDHYGKGVIFLLDGAVDTRWERTGNGLFPEMLKSELHEVRSVIKAYSKEASLQGADEASACGLSLNDNNLDWDAKFRVTVDGNVSEYVLDRWD